MLGRHSHIKVTDASNQGAISDNCFAKKGWFGDRSGKGVIGYKKLQNPGNVRFFPQFGDFGGKCWSRKPK